jgi:hypothetical protein
MSNTKFDIDRDEYLKITWPDKSVSKIHPMAVIIGIIVAICAFLTLLCSSNHLDYKVKACREKGGTYLYHESKCIAVPEIQIP